MGFYMYTRNTHIHTYTMSLLTPKSGSISHNRRSNSDLRTVISGLYVPLFVRKDSRFILVRWVFHYYRA